VDGVDAIKSACGQQTNMSRTSAMIRPSSGMSATRRADKNSTYPILQPSENEVNISICPIDQLSYEPARPLRLLFGEAKSQQRVKGETRVSDPSESVVPACQPAQNYEAELTNSVHLPHVQVVRMLVQQRWLQSPRTPASS
jgi:hypothetical protein